VARLKVCVAGATGWAGSALSRGIFRSEDLELVSAVSRTHDGMHLGPAIGIEDVTAPCHDTIEGALTAAPDVVVEYTTPEAAKAHALAALRAGAHVVVGTSGLSGDDYDEIDALARDRNRGVLAVGNFALTVVLLQRFAEIAARYVPHWEVIDYASAGKPDAPSGTARELAHRLGAVRESTLDVRLEETAGHPEARGARLDGTQVHSLRLPGFVIGLDAVFGMPDQRLVLRHEAGTSAEPYVDGALLAIREVGRLVGVHRGLDAVMDL